MLSCIALFQLLVTISAHTFKSGSLVERLFADPKSFVATFEKADPAAVNSVIDLVKSLIAEGQDKKNNIIAEHEAAKVATTDAQAELATALDVLEMAAGERVEADEEVVRLEDVLGAKKTAESAASDAKTIANGVLVDAQTWMTQEVERIDSELASFEEVKNILSQVPTSFRRRLLSGSPLIPLSMLSSVSKVDPTAIEELTRLVNDLINAGEGVRIDVTKARDDAQTDLDVKTTAWEFSVQETVDAEDELDAGRTDAANKLVVQNAKREIFDAATAKKDAAVADEAAKLGVRDTEVPILDHEDEQLNEVVSILENLLPQE